MYFSLCLSEVKRLPINLNMWIQNIIKKNVLHSHWTLSKSFFIIEIGFPCHTLLILRCNLPIYNFTVKSINFYKNSSHQSFKHWKQSEDCLELALQVSFIHSWNSSLSFFKTKNWPSTTYAWKVNYFHCK